MGVCTYLPLAKVVNSPRAFMLVDNCPVNITSSNPFQATASGFGLPELTLTSTPPSPLPGFYLAEPGPLPSAVGISFVTGAELNQYNLDDYNGVWSLQALGPCGYVAQMQTPQGRYPQIWITSLNTPVQTDYPGIVYGMNIADVPTYNAGCVCYTIANSLTFNCFPYGDCVPNIFGSVSA